MGLFKRPGSKFWQTEFEIKNIRVSRSTGETSRRAAEAFERRLRDEIAAKAPEIRKREKVGSIDQACGRYWIEHGQRLRGARDTARWLRYLTTYLDKSKMLSDLSTADVTQMVADMREAGRGEIAINRTVTCLQGVHNRAAKNWEWPVKVIAWKGHKTKERGRVAHITPEQAQALLSALPAHTAAVVRFLLLTGLRQREAFELTWDKVESDAVTVIVKGGYARRVLINDEASDLLASLPREGRYVFDTTNWRKHFEAAKRKVGPPSLRWHDLRHSCATWLGQGGAPLEVIRDQLGHSSISVTQKYRHVVAGEVREALQSLPKLGKANVVRIRKG
jgi:integrase